jgi:hypothetical protein
VSNIYCIVVFVLFFFVVYRTSQHETKNVKTGIGQQQKKPKKMSNTDPTKNPRVNSKVLEKGK